MCKPVAALILAPFALCANAQEPIITPPLRIDPSTAQNRWAAEYSAVAHGSYLAAMWMKEPAQQAIGGRRLFSGDYGTTFAIEDWELPNNEVDPMSAVAVDGDGTHFWLGAKQGTAKLFVSRRDSDDAQWGNTVYAYEPGSQIDKCWMAAGPTPGIIPGDTRIYIGSIMPNDFDILWSDDLGATWSTPIDVGLGIHRLPRIGLSGEFYISHIMGANLRMKRSITLNPDLSPKFIASDTTAMTYTAGVGDASLPGTFRAFTLGCIAVHPQDGKRVYAVFEDVTSFGGGNSNIDVYFTKTDDATATNANGDDLVQWDERKIIPAGIEVPGDQFFPWLEVTQTGTTTRLHLVYFSTQQNPNQQDGTTDPNCLIDVYYAYSDDEGESWHEYRLTPASFNAADCGGPGGSFLGDYLGMAVADNRVYPFFPMPAGSPLESEPHLCCIVFGKPGTLADLIVAYGTINSGNLASLGSSDDSRLNVAAGPRPLPTSPYRCDVRVGITNTENAPSAIDIALETHNSTDNVTARVSLKNWNSGEFDLWGSFPLTASDQTFYMRGIAPANYIRSSDQRIEVKLEHERAGGVIFVPFEARFDQLIVNVIK